MRLYNKKALKSVIAVCSAAVLISGVTPAAALNYDEPELSEIRIVETDSGNGDIDYKFVDENGNEVKSDLTPDIQMSEDLGSYYNLYDHNRVTSVKNQNPLGLCWTFSALASAESSLITQGLASTDVDFSEKHLAWFTHGANVSDMNDPLYGDDIGNYGVSAYNMGGNELRAANILSRGTGPVYEELVPYSVNTALSEDLRYRSEYHLEEMKQYDITDKASIKNAVVNEGAVKVSYYAFDEDDFAEGTVDPYYNSSTSACYCPDEKDTNHAVTIVGWDDNFSADNFLQTPLGDGAWIIKNSWGTDFGDDGLCYISYYDASLDRPASFIMTSKDSWDNIYQYDGNLYTKMYYSSYMISGANIFTADSDEILKGVGFWTTEAEVPYKISVYTGIPEGGNPTDGELVHTQSGTEDYAGYHTVRLDKAVELSDGCRYSVVLDLLKIGARLEVDSYAAVEGVSFLSHYDNGYRSWKNCNVNEVNRNVRIKALTDEKEIEEEVLPGPTGLKVAENTTDSITIEWDPVEDAEYYAVRIREYGTDTEWINVGTVNDCAMARYGTESGKEYEVAVCAYISGDVVTEYAVLRVVTLAAVSDEIGINITNFPDTEFRKYVRSEFDTDQNGHLSLLEIAVVFNIDVSNKGISDLKGIEYFTSLSYLECSDNYLSALDVSKNTRLSTLCCSNNRLTALDLSNNTKMDILICRGNSLPYNNMEEYSIYVIENIPDDRVVLTAAELRAVEFILDYDYSNNIDE